MARDDNVDELVCGIEECYGSIVVEDGDDLIILLNKDYFCHQQVMVTVKLSFEDLV